jgi:hypothetical protein
MITSLSIDLKCLRERKKGNKKFHLSLVIVSGQTNKHFPHDFFESKHNTGNITHRGDNPKLIKKDLAKIYIPTDPINEYNKKRLLDFDKEMEEDKELLELLNTNKSRYY